MSQSQRDAFGALRPLCYRSNTSVCSHGQSVVNPHPPCGKPAVAWFAQAGGGTTPVPAIVGRCARHAEALDLPQIEAPAEHTTTEIVAY